MRLSRSPFVYALQIGWSRVWKAIVDGVFYEPTTSMRLFLAVDALVQTIWLLLPGDSINTPTTALIRLIFGSDEVMAITPFLLFIGGMLSESLVSRRLRVIVAAASAIWWSLIGICGLISRFNSLGSAFWMTLGICSAWVVWRNVHRK